MKIILTKNMIIGMSIKPPGSILSVPTDISEQAAAALVEMGKAILQAVGQVQQPASSPAAVVAPKPPEEPDDKKEVIRPQASKKKAKKAKK